MANAFKQMPHQLKVLFGVFFFVPIFSTFFFRKLIPSTGDGGTWELTLIIATYWVLPLLLCVSLLVRHFLFLPIYMLQSLALGIHCVAHSEGLSFDLAMSRYIMVGLMAYVGLTFLNKDYLYPFLAKRSRAWRKHPRLEVKFGVDLCGTKPEHRIPAVIENVSLSGMALRIDKKYGESFIKKLEVGESVGIHLRWPGRDHLVESKIIWSRQQEDRILGIASEQSRILGQFMGWASEQQEFETRLYRPAGHVLEREMHRTALFLWVLFILLSFGLPTLASL